MPAITAQQYCFVSGWGFKSSSMHALAENIGLPQMNIICPCLYTNGVGNLSLWLSTQITVPTILFGWSYGGLVALQVAQQNPQVKGLVLLASTPCFINKADWFFGIDETAIEDLCDRLVAQPQQALNYFSALINHDGKSQLDLRHLRQHLVTADQKNILISCLDNLQQTDFRLELVKINLPILFVLGKQDVLLDYKQATVLSQINPKIKLKVLEDMGHALPFYPLTHLVSVIKRFLS